MNPISAIEEAISAGELDKARILITTELAISAPGLSPEVCHLRYLSVIVSRFQKQFEQALQQALELVELTPHSGRAWQELGHVYTDMNKDEQAALAYRRGVEVNSALIPAWQKLRGWYQATNNVEALKFTEKQLVYLQSLPAELVKAKVYLYEKRFDIANSLCRQFLQVNGNHVEGLFILAQICLAYESHLEAENALQICLQLEPGHTQARLTFMALLMNSGKFAKAVAVTENLGTINDQEIRLWGYRAAALSHLGRVAEAIVLYDELLKLDSAEQHYFFMLSGHAHKTQGNYERAIRAYCSAIEAKPDFGEVWWSLANTKKYQFSVEQIGKMSDMLESPEVSVKDKTYLFFALGKGWEDQGDFAQSFHFYQQGNALQQQAINYQPEYFEQLVSQQTFHCRQSLFNQIKSAENEGPVPIFIVGLPRSGSTLLEQILASHSMVDSTMELLNVQSIINRVFNNQEHYAGYLYQLTPEQLKQMGETYLTETRDFRKGAPYFIDKMPNNFKHIALIKLMLPNAIFIDARRDPMAACFSCFKQLFATGYHFSYSLNGLGKYYNDYLRLMNHWDKVLPGEVLTVQYEEVVNNLEFEVRRLLNFCGLPFEEACVAFHQTNRNIHTPSSEQVRQPIYRSGLEQWRNFESHLAPLKAILVTE